MVAYFLFVPLITGLSKNSKRRGDFLQLQTFRKPKRGDSLTAGSVGPPREHHVIVQNGRKPKQQKEESKLKNEENWEKEKQWFTDKRKLFPASFPFNLPSIFLPFFSFRPNRV